MSPVGGFKSFLENLAQRLVDNGCQVTVLSLSGQNDVTIAGTEQRTFDLIGHSSAEHLSLGDRISSLIERLLFRLKGCSEKQAFKHNLFHSQLKAVSRAKTLPQPLDLSEYDCVISCEEVQCNYLLAYGVIAKQKIGYIHPDYQNVPYNRRIDRTALSKLDYVCATSETNAATIRRAQPSLKKKVIGVPNPIEVKTILQKAEGPVDESFDQNTVNLITVCRLDNTYKALDRLLSVSEKMKQNGAEFVWRVIGDGDYDAEMRAYIRQHELQDFVVMLGAKDNPIPYVKRSDLFVLQSYSEGYPMSVLEALAVDTPVLVTDYPSSREQVDDGVTGYIVQNDFDSVYSMIYEVVENREKLSTLQENLKRMDKSKLESIDALLEIMR